MLSISNTLDYNLTRMKALRGKVSSIWAGDFYFNGVNSFPVLPIRFLTSNFTSFEKLISPASKMIYHLSGYGSSYNEALRGFLGEASERYSFAVLSELIKSRLVKATYTELLSDVGKDGVFPLEYLNIYKMKDSEGMVDKDDSIYWVRMNSLSNPSHPFYAPMQYVISGGSVLYPEEKRYCPSSVSTGTACHETLDQALENAAIECLQIDSFELWWYGGIKGNRIWLDCKEFLSPYFSQFHIDRFLDAFSIEITDISFNKGIYIFVCELFSKKHGLPKYTVGVQGGLDKRKAIYRCIMEALSVLEYNMGLPWMDYKKWSMVDKNISDITNFDDNVIKYAKFGKPKLVENDISLKEEKKYKSALKYLRDRFPRSGYLVITSPEVSDMNLEVVRLCVPELISLSLPSFPPELHKGFVEIGGIKNYVAHPLA